MAIAPAKSPDYDLTDLRHGMKSIPAIRLHGTSTRLRPNASFQSACHLGKTESLGSSRKLTIGSENEQRAGRPEMKEAAPFGAASSLWSQSYTRRPNRNANKNAQRPTRPAARMRIRCFLSALDQLRLEPTIPSEVELGLDPAPNVLGHGKAGSLSVLGAASQVDRRREAGKPIGFKPLKRLVGEAGLEPAKP